MEKSLFNIENEYLELANLILENEGEITDEIIQALQINKNELSVKAGGYSKVIKQAKGEVSIIDAEIKRLQGEKKKRQNLEKRLKGALESALIAFDIEKLETPLCKVSFRKSKAVEFDNIEKLPAECIVIERKVSKAALKSLLEEGAEIEGAEIVVNKSIQIK